MTPIPRHERVSHRRPRTHAVERLREVVGRCNGRTHLRHGIIMRPRRISGCSREVEVARRGERRGGEAACVWRGGGGKITVRGRGCGAGGLRARVRALGAQVKPKGQCGGSCAHARAVLLRIHERVRLEVGIARVCRRCHSRACKVRLVQKAKADSELKGTYWHRRSTRSPQG